MQRLIADFLPVYPRTIHSQFFAYFRAPILYRLTAVCR